MVDLIKNFYYYDVIYHYPCIDGAYSCFLLNKYFKYINLINNNINYYGLKSSNNIKETLIKIIKNNTINILKIFLNDINLYHTIYIVDKGISLEEIKLLFDIEKLYCIELENTHTLQIVDNNIKKHNIKFNITINIIDHHITTINSLDEYLLNIKDNLEKKDFTNINNIHNTKEFEIIELNTNNCLSNLNNNYSIKFVYSRDNIYSACSLTYKYVSLCISQLIKNINSTIHDIYDNEIIDIISLISDEDTGLNTNPKSKIFKSGICHILSPLESKLLLNTTKIESMFNNLSIRHILNTGEKQLTKINKEVINSIQSKMFYIIEINDIINCKLFKFIGLSVNKSRIRNYCGLYMEKISKANNLDSIGAVIYSISDNMIKVSLRKERLIDNIKDDYNLAYISSIYNGGGHKTAASFIIHRSKFNKIAKSINDVEKIKIPKYNVL